MSNKKQLKADCPACGASYPLSMCGIPETPRTTADIVCVLCHYHFSVHLVESKLFGISLKKSVEVKARIQPDNTPLEFSKTSAKGRT